MVSLEPKNRVCFTYQARRFHPDRSGTVQVRLRTRDAVQIAELLTPPGHENRDSAHRAAHRRDRIRQLEQSLAKRHIGGAAQVRHGLSQGSVTR